MTRQGRVIRVLLSGCDGHLERDAEFPRLRGNRACVRPGASRFPANGRAEAEVCDARARLPLRRRRGRDRAAPASASNRSEGALVPRRRSIDETAQRSWTAVARGFGRSRLVNQSSPRRCRRGRPSSSSRAGRPSAASKRQVLGPRRQRLRRARWGHGQRVAPDRPRKG
jgi:hypothetical protein